VTLANGTCYDAPFSGFYNPAPRDNIIGPGAWNDDFSIYKHFKIGEKVDLRFAADFFNLWNHPNFSNPLVTDYEQYLAWSASSETSPDPFGRIVQTTGTPRLIQFSLRWTF